MRKLMFSFSFNGCFAAFCKVQNATFFAAQALFADAKTAENHTEQIIGGKFTGDFIQTHLRQAQMLGQQINHLTAIGGKRQLLRGGL